MKIPHLLAISSPEVRAGSAWRQWCSDLAAAGVDGLQVRRKDCTDRDLLALAAEARVSTAATVTLLVNARPDIALAADADGVQLPAQGLPVTRVRATFDHLSANSFLVGRSTHSPDEVRLARDQGADFALFGPLFETPSKAGRIAPRGLVALSEAVSCGLPVLALGGIDGENAPQALDAGAWGIAAIRWFENPLARRSDYAALLLRWRQP
ncbi:MAG: thiamine phosphate synthase [Thermoanaerobaculia bacterium]